MLVRVRQHSARRRREISRAHDQITRRLEARCARALQPFWRAVARETVARLAALHRWPEESDVPTLWQAADWRGRFRRVMDPQWSRMLWTGVDFEATFVRTAGPPPDRQHAPIVRRQDLGPPPPSIHVDPSPELERELRRVLAERRVGVWDTLAKTTQKRLAGAIVKGLKEGDDLDDLTARVRGVLTRYGEAQARRVARTETTHAMGAAQQANRVDLGITAKEWISTLDSRTRGADPKDIFDHLAPDGQVVANDQPFIISGEMMMHPGDSSLGASVGSIANCRCAAVSNWDTEPPVVRRVPVAPPAPTTPTPVQPPAPALPVGPRNGMTFTGTPTDFSRRVWDEIGDGIKTEVQARKVGKEIVEEALKALEADKKAVMARKLLDDARKELTRLEAVEAEAKKRFDAAKAAVKKNPADEVAVRRANLLKNVTHNASLDVKSHRDLRLRAAANTYSRHANRHVREKLAEVRDMGRRNHVVKRSVVDQHHFPVEDRVSAEHLSSAEDLLSGFDEALDRYPTDFVGELAELSEQGEFGVAQIQRAYYDDANRHVLTSGRDHAAHVKTFIHELGHAAEDRVKGRVAVKNLEREFMERRTAGMPHKTRTRIYAGKPEYGWKDEFVEHYIGKDYNGAYYEVFTVGVESVLSDQSTVPVWLDRDMIEFVVGILAGG